MSVGLHASARATDCHSGRTDAHPRRMDKTAGDAQRMVVVERMVGKLTPSEIERSANEHRAFQRARGITCAKNLLVMALCYALTNFSLGEVAAWAACVDLADVSGEALCKRLAHCQSWLGYLLEQKLITMQTAAMVALQTLAPVIQDATVICVVGSKGTDYRVHLKLNLATQKIADVVVTDAKGGEFLGRLRLQAGDLVIADRIYGTRQSAAAALAVAAEVLVRITHTNMPMCDEQGKRLDLLALARQCPTDKPLSLPVTTVAVHRKNEELPAISGRLVIARKGSVAAERDRRKLRQETKGTPKAKTLEAQDYIWVFTTLPEEVLSAELVMDLYRFRWQVECCFKRQKSVLELDCIRAKKPETVQAVLYAKLLAVLCLDEMVAHWEKAFEAAVGDPTAVMLPLWRMMRQLWASMKVALGVFLLPEEWGDSPPGVLRRMVQGRRPRTRERNEKLAAILSQLEAHALS